MLVELHGADEDVDGGLGLILEDVGLVLGEEWLVVIVKQLVEGLGSLTTGKALVVAAKRPSPRESLVKTCMANSVNR